jgi:membrane protein implicated in regulation of membrane protease activity
VTRAAVVPVAPPFRGIHSFRYADRSVFFARDRQIAELVPLVSIYRGVLLYGDSGAGKSSLVNAGLIPAMKEIGYLPERFRLQPIAGEELVVEPIEGIDYEAGQNARRGRRTATQALEAVPIAALEERLARRQEDDDRTLLIFDQFEEIVTLFQEAPHDRPRSELLRMQRSIVAELVRLLNHPTLRVKLLFVFREDYLAHVVKLFADAPYLRDQHVRLTPPPTDALLTIIRGPFDAHPERYQTEISPRLAEELAAALAERTESDEVNLSEVQIVCLRLWRADDPEQLFREKGVRGLLEDHMADALSDLDEDDKYAAVALLNRMITASGARNVISEEDLVERVNDDTGIRERKLKKTLQLLEKAALVRREQRHGRPFYEIVSEFLVPWIVRQREEKLAQEQLDVLLRQITIEELQAHERLFRSFRFSRWATVLTLTAAIAAVVAVAILVATGSGLPWWASLIVITVPLAALALVQIYTTQRSTEYRQAGARLVQQRQELEELVGEGRGLTGGQVHRLARQFDDYATQPVRWERRTTHD